MGKILAASLGAAAAVAAFIFSAPASAIPHGGVITPVVIVADGGAIPVAVAPSTSLDPREVLVLTSPTKITSDNPHTDVLVQNEGPNDLSCRGDATADAGGNYFIVRKNGGSFSAHTAAHVWCSASADQVALFGTRVTEENR